MDKVNPWFLHVDLDAFFASVEQLDHPEYKGKPVIVGGLPEDKRSVVSTASYEARKYGVHSAMPTFMAYKLCPNGIYVHGRMKRYAELSYQIMNIFKEYSPDVDQMSIDEAFIDLTGTEKIFGPPWETAKKIKAHVKQNTGLTVSVGLASNKYIAKIASGFSKPDGFYFVEPGNEQEFMLNLPLEKVWGVGSKTLENLRKKGLCSTRDIYNQSFESLEFLFGKNSANFLYNVVRGINPVNFGQEAKKHSISSETTFAEDITDKYTAETQLMDLCHSVIFRLIRENSFSRTAYLKIRYDDFSTVSIQKTTDQNILTLDTYFEIIKRLFEKKYENGRGIRLLGVGLDNIEKEDRPYQQDLFITTNTKKQAVEKAIVGLEKKHPEIKIQKARMLNKTIKSLSLFVLLHFLTCGTTLLNAQEISKTQITGSGTILSDTIIPPSQEELSEIEKDGESLFSWDIDDKNNVDFILSGYWIGKFSAGENSSFGNGTSLVFSLAPMVFTQEVDISSWILLNQKWYFEADFADQFEKNTIALGYKGDGYLKSFRLSNRGITFPDLYSAAAFGYGLSGGNNQAPGLSMHFSDLDDKLWNCDFVVRYDMTKTNSATFYGKNSVTDSHLSLSDFVYGKSFILPESCSSFLTQIDQIYVENENGEYLNKNGKKFKKLSSADYLILPLSSQIIFTDSAKTSRQKDKVPEIIVTFTNTTAVSSIISQTGLYSDSNSFAGQIQSYFNTYTDRTIELSKYAYNLDTIIDGKSGLILQKSELFSPFLCANIYDCGLNKDSDTFVESKSDGKINTEYNANEFSLDFADLSSDFLQENHYFAQISSANCNNSSYQNPAYRFPLADNYPEVYLSNSSDSNLYLTIRNYTPVDNIQIGTDAIPGTVQVYINNRLATGSSYNNETGIIELPAQVSDTDKIYIIWQEDSSNFSLGALAAGAGFIYNFNPEFSADFSVTTRWPLSPNEKYATVQSPLNGFAAFSGGVIYKKENLELTQKTALSINSVNSSENLLIFSQSAPGVQTSYLGNNDGFVTKSQPQINTNAVYVLTEEKNCTVKNHGGVSDSHISGYKIPLEWDFSDADLIDAQNAYNNKVPYWAAVDINLDDGKELKNSDMIEVALQSVIPQGESQNYDIYLQMGIKAGDSWEGEDVESIPCWKLSDNSDSNVLAQLNASNTDWQTVICSILPDNRTKFTSDYDARLIVIYNPSDTSATYQSKGTLFFGPYEQKIQSFFLKNNENILVTTHSQLDNTTPSVKKLSLTQNFVTQIEWKDVNAGLINNDSIITASSFFDGADFSNYKLINIEFACTPCGNASFALLSSSDSLQKALEISLLDPQNYCSQTTDFVYHTLSINTQNNKVYIDGAELSSSNYTLYLNNQIIPDKLLISIDTQKDGNLINSGTFNVGNIYYSDTDLYFDGINYFGVKYAKNDVLLKIKDFDFIKNPFVQMESTQSVSKVFTGNINTGITIADVILQADLDSNYNSGHKIQTESPLLGVFSFGETYRFLYNENELNKKDSASLNFKSLKLEYETSAKDNRNLQTQNSRFFTSYEAKINESNVGISSEYKASQKVNFNKFTPNNIDVDNYFINWYDISQLQFSTGEQQAANRKQTLSSRLYTDIKKLKIAPELSYNLESNYHNVTSPLIQDSTTIKFAIPLTFDKNTFSFEIGRTGGGMNSWNDGGSYFSDSKIISDSYSDKTWIYTSIPFYELFDKSLPSKISTLPSSTTQSTSYSALYKLGWKRKLNNTYSDLFIPSSSELNLTRDVKTAAQTSDIYQVKCVISNTALNCFGSQSNLKLFEWYAQDEFLSNFTGIIKIPRDLPSAKTFTLSIYQQSLFYVNNNSNLKTSIDFSLEDFSEWKLGTTCIWTRPGKVSLLAETLKFCFKNKSDIVFTVKNSDVFNIKFQKASDAFSQLYEYSHNTDVEFLKNYTFTAGIGTSLLLNKNSATNLGCIMTIGGKLLF